MRTSGLVSLALVLVLALPALGAQRMVLVEEFVNCG
jgi:hypothetical protein